MELTTVWFVIIAFLWTGYFVLEGFDFGVGVLAPALSRDETDRRQILQTIGPVWDGNEVWLITAVGAMFAAFPVWYATFLSTFYPAMLLILVGLIVRGVGLEWRGKVTTARERAWCDLGILAGSLVPAFAWGAVFAVALRGSAVAALVGGLFTLVLAVLHGAVFLALKTAGPVRARARRTALAAAAAALPLAVVALSHIPASRVPVAQNPAESPVAGAPVEAAAGTAATGAAFAAAPWLWATALAAMAVLAAGVALTARGRDGWAFAATASAIALGSAALFGALWPAPLPGLAGDPAAALTVAQAASGPYTLTLLTWIGLIALPFVLGYQGWTYWVFRKRLTRAAVAS